jgi:putative transposase
MPRKPRIEYSGAFYHVIVRGNQKQRVFKDAADFQKYLLTLSTYKNRSNCRVYAYVLMNNHVHLLLEAQDVPLSKVMQGLNQTYTMYFNRRYRTVGHLFQGRYKAILCDREDYLLGLLKYIHENPVRAKIAERLDVYPWSSHQAYTGKSNPLSLVDTGQVLKMFSENKARARKKYREYMAQQDGFDRKEVYATIDQRLKGDDEFVDRVLAQHDKEPSKERLRRPTLQDISHVVEKRYGVSLVDMRSYSKNRKLVLARRVFCIVASTRGYKAVEVGRFLEKEPTMVTLALRGREEVSGEMKAIEGLMGNIPGFQV